MFSNDPRLSEKEIETIVAWVDGGAAKGDDKDLPKPPQFVDGWTIGKPDAIFSMTEDFQIPATGAIPYQYLRVPTNLTGPERDDDRRIISGIIHMLQCGARWRDCPPEYGPYTTIYNRFNRWSKRGRWRVIFEALANCGKRSVTLSIDSTSIKAHRSASGGKGGSTNRRSAARAADAPRKSMR